MSQTEFESNLKKKTIKRRLICLLIFAVSLAMGIACVMLLNNSIDKKGSDAEMGYVSGVVIGFVIAVVSGVLLLSDLMFWSYKTLTIDGSYITIYRGMFGVSLYIDGEFADVTYTKFRNYIEGQLKDGTNVSVALSSFSLHVTFSNGHAPIDLDYITRD